MTPEFSVSSMYTHFVMCLLIFLVLPKYFEEIAPDSLDGEESDSKDNLDDISSVTIDWSMQFDLNKVPKEDNESL